MTTGPVVGGADDPIAAEGATFGVHEWRGAGPAQLHVHHADDEAWHVLAGTLTFRFGDEVRAASAGDTVFVPAGTPHTFDATDDARYLIVLTPRLRALIDELHTTPPDRHDEVYARHASALLE